ncbi:MAG: glycine cleavage system aminomethyltransferase GcvT [Acidobacteriota bacterium]
MIRKTPLNEIHKKLGARMIEFVGWEMPVQYSGVIEEHNAVRGKAGLFDVSHMGEIQIRGRDALAFVQKITCNDASKLTVGKVQYSALVYPQGTFVDDILVYRISDDEFMLCVNAANTNKDYEWIRNHLNGSVEAVNRSTEYSQIAIQGPLAQEILSSFVNADLTSIGYYRFAMGKVGKWDAIISRTGYTGEDGFEIYSSPESAPDIWNMLYEAGTPKGLKAAGLAARDTLRLEAKMALYGNDIDDTTTVLEADLMFILKMEKGNFIGREALQKQMNEGIKRKLVGFEVTGKGIARHGYQAYAGDRKVGMVTSGTFAPYLQKSIGLIYLPLEMTAVGMEFEIDIRGKRTKAIVVPTPFYKRKK